MGDFLSICRNLPATWGQNNQITKLNIPATTAAVFLCFRGKNNFHYSRVRNIDKHAKVIFYVVSRDYAELCLFRKA